MSEQIEVGDLVQVVRNRARKECRCPLGRMLGKIFKVEKISFTESRCARCGTTFVADLCAWIEGEFHVVEIYRLKRIPPLPELEAMDQEHKLDVRA